MMIRKIKLNAAQYVAIGFAGVILMGALLLCLPIATAPGKTTSFIDALFTATTSVCVTGLVTVTTATHWSLFGKFVILLLIQMGGLGVVSVIMISFVALKRKIGLKNRKLIQEAYNLDHLSGVVRMIKNIVLGTFVVEGMGTIAYSIAFIPKYGVAGGIWRALFNAVSCFCNAGMDILDESSLMPYVTNPLVNVTTMLLIIVSGIGFVVWWDLKKVAVMVMKKEILWKRTWSRLELHTKLALSITLFLLVVGTIGFFFAEYSNPGTMKDLSFGNKIMASAFQPVTTRTAGFATVDQGQLTDFSVFLSVMLMFIGGSPMGTAGGMKTTTIGIIVLMVIAYFKGKDEIEAFHRRLSADNLRTAIVVVMVGFFVLLLSMSMMTILTDFDFLDLLFEITSAVGTVGLSRGITSSFSTAAKVVVILTMYAGRIGPVTLMMAISIRTKIEKAQIHKPEKKVLIG